MLPNHNNSENYKTKTKNNNLLASHKAQDKQQVRDFLLQLAKTQNCPPSSSLEVLQRFQRARLQ